MYVALTTSHRIIQTQKRFKFNINNTKRMKTYKSDQETSRQQWQ
jgi:hypothetical protein